jgi:lysophospholipase L1-like esterase
MSWLRCDPRATHRRSRILLLLLATAAGLASACGGDTPTAPTVPSIQPFVMQCPADVLGQSTTGAPVSLQVPTPTTSGGVLPVTVSCSPAGTPFPVGTTRVSCSASDARSAAASCTFNVNVAPPPLSRTTFLAFGDSLTEGEITVPVSTSTGAIDADGFPNFRLIVVPSESYPTKLLALLRNRYFTQAQQFIVTNSGKGKEWALDGAKRLPSVLAATRPQVVLLLAGANDLEALPNGTGLNNAIVGLQTMVRTARTSGAAVFLATLPPVRPGGRLSLNVSLVQSLNATIRTGAPVEGATLVDLDAAMAPNVATLIGVDGLHPTEAGYQRMAEAFFTAIRTTFEGR